ncbi:MAG: SDR family oxidoreductase [Burkholderiales bacterium]|nr:SDR family oxidoreductase [Burkholderiales bacterium]
MSATPYRAVLTGATGGIGRAIAVRLAPRCAMLLLVARDGAKLEALQRGIIGNGGRCRTVAADLTTEAGRDAVLRAAQALPGGIDLLVNNAGAGAFALLADQDDAALERIVRVNLLAPMQLARRLLPLLRAQPTAHVVNIGSIFGYLGYPGCATYSASKFALRGFSEALRRELADSPVRVSHLAPRAVRTAMNSAALCALNAELGVAMDDPEIVADALMALLRRPARERLLGMPERLFARLNQILPGLVDRALRRQLPVIRRHARGEGAAPAEPMDTSAHPST